MRRFGIFILAFLTNAAMAWGSSFFVYEGKLTDSAGFPIGDTTPVATTFSLEIIGQNLPLATRCVLYRESRTINVEKGNFSITVGRGADTSQQPLSFETIFGQAPMTGLSSCSFDPLALDSSRVLSVTVNSEPLGDVVLAESSRATVAGNSEKLGGLHQGYFFRVMDGTAPFPISSWTKTDYQKLQSLVTAINVNAGAASVTGTSAGFTGPLSGDVSGTQSSTQVTHLQGRAVANSTPGDGQVLSWNNAQTRWEPRTPVIPAESDPSVAGYAKKAPSPEFSTTGDTLSLANGAVTTAKIADNTILGTDLNFTGINGPSSGFVLKDGSGKFFNMTCATPGEVPTWTLSGFACQLPTFSEIDPKVGSNTLNKLSKWNGSQLVDSGIFENGGKVGIGTTTPGDKLHVAGKIRAQELCDESGANCKNISSGWGGGGTVTSVATGPGLVGGTITGSGTIGLGLELLGLNSLSTTGFVKRTAAGAYSAVPAVDISSEVTGTLPIAQGGTGAVSQSAAINNLLPAQAGNASKVLQTNGSNVSWVSTPPAGITALTGDVTATGPGNVSATISAGAVKTATIADGAVTDVKIASMNASKLTLTCPSASGFTAIYPNSGGGSPFCINTMSSGSASFLTAAATCGGSGYELCSVRELLWACARGHIPSGVASLWGNISDAGYATVYNVSSCSTNLGSVVTESTTLSPKKYYCCIR